MQNEYFPGFPLAWFGVGPQKLFDVYLGALSDYTLPPIDHKHALRLSGSSNETLSPNKNATSLKLA